MRNSDHKKEMLKELLERKWRFLGVFFLVFFLTLSFLAIVGAVPGGVFSTAPEAAEKAENAKNANAYSTTIEPERVVIEKIGVDAPIGNPQSRDIAVLDESLKDGVVHFPGSANLNDETNLFLFGHSSYLPVVYNKNFKVFNNLDKLEPGDQIHLQGGGEEYLYQVRNVRLDEAAAIRVDLSGSKKMLTLSTCNSFGAEGERFVVEADFVGSYLISS